MEESKKPAIRDVLKALDRRYPFGSAAAWDNVGLLAGEAGRRVQRILISVDVTPRLIDHAITSRYDLIVTHHPLFVEPLKRVTDEQEEGSNVVRILRSGISLISVHTNADLSPHGVSRELAERLRLVNLSPLRTASERTQHKVVVFVPSDNVKGVLEAAFSSGAGMIGDYSACSFRTSGTGTFYPSERARPHVGEVEKANEVLEERVEFIVDDVHLVPVLESVRGSHPYEEPAIDVYTLRGGLPEGWLGVKGECEVNMSLREFLHMVRDAVQPTTIRYAGDLQREVRNVGVLGGSGGGFVDNVIGSDIDLFLTGDLKHHQVHRLAHASIIGVDIGHFDSEKFIMAGFKRVIEEEFKDAVAVDTYDDSTEYMRVFS